MAEEKLPVRGPQGDLLVKEKARTKRPPMYAVVLLNDDFTPMEFVVWILQAVFHKAMAEATHLMLRIHNDGKGVCGIYTHDVARTKALQVERLARKHEHPLECVLEACEG